MIVRGSLAFTGTSWLPSKAVVTDFEKPLPVYVGIKDQPAPVVVMATSAEIVFDGDSVAELILRDRGQVVGRFPRSGYVWWIADQYAHLD